VKIEFRTNLDQYQGYNVFGTGEMWENVPQKGDFVNVSKYYIGKYVGLKLPRRLEVTSVTWEETSMGVVATCELWYNKTDLELAKIANAPYFG
jgi:hypothetical protein